MAVLTMNRQKAQKSLLDHYLKSGFSDDEDLLFYVREFLGFKYPKKAFCSHHDAPATTLCALYFERSLYTLLWANRTGGKTQMMSILNHLDALFKGPIEICSAGAAREQAEKGYQYFLKSFDHPLLKEFLPDPIQSRSILTNGSKVEIITGSLKGFNGPHPQKVRIDEVELMEWRVLEEGMNMSQSKGNVKAQDVLSSTRKVSAGPVQRLLDERVEKRLDVFSHCIWDIVEQCDRECKNDKVYGDCPIYHLCGGKAHGGRGWYKIEDLVKKGTGLSKGTFEAQWENKRPSDASLVYDTFNRETHVKTWDQLYTMFKVDEFKKKRFPKEWTHIGGVDFGTNFAFLIMVIEPKTRTWILGNEYFSNVDRRLQDHIRNIKALRSFNDIDVTFADTAGKQDRIELRAQGGIRTKEAIKNKDSILLGIDEVKRNLETNENLEPPRPKLFILDDCVNTIKEFEMWSWKTQDDGRPDMEDPQEGNDHCMDALRYIIYSYGRVGASYAVTTVEGL